MGIFKKIFSKSNDNQESQKATEISREEMISFLMEDSEDVFNRNCKEKNVVFPSFEARDEAYKNWGNKMRSIYERMDDESLRGSYDMHRAVISLKRLAREYGNF